MKRISKEELEQIKKEMEEKEKSIREHKIIEK